MTSTARKSHGESEDLTYVTTFLSVAAGGSVPILAGPTFPVPLDIEFLEPAGVTTSGGATTITISQYTSSPPFFVPAVVPIIPGIFAPARVTWPMLGFVYCELWVSPARALRTRLRP